MAVVVAVVVEAEETCGSPGHHGIEPWRRAWVDRFSSAPVRGVGVSLIESMNVSMNVSMSVSMVSSVSIVCRYAYRLWIGEHLILK